MIIAIDGPAGAGKSTTAKQVAKRMQYTYLDTGAMYRAVALSVLRSGLFSSPIHCLTDPPRRDADALTPDSPQVETPRAQQTLSRQRRAP